LYVLDAATGQYQWSQELAAVEKSLRQDPFRRMAGATPAIEDNVIVCPTSCGGMIAVDLATQTLLWAYQYRALAAKVSGSRSRELQPQLEQGNRWIDATALIAEGRVVLTPPESTELHCRQPRGRAAALDTEPGRRNLCGVRPPGEGHRHRQTRVSALDLADGKTRLGRPHLVSGRSLPSGRGVHSGSHYYLPLSNATIVPDRPETSGAFPANLARTARWSPEI